MIITRDKALKTLKRLFGDKAWWRVGDPVSSPERRAKARQDADALQAQMDTIDAEIKRRQIAAGIPDLNKQRHALAQQRQEALGWARYRKFNVGQHNGLCIEITGEGDTWAEALAAVEAKKARTTHAN